MLVLFRWLEFSFGLFLSPFLGLWLEMSSSASPALLAKMLCLEVLSSKCDLFSLGTLPVIIRGSRRECLPGLIIIRWISRSSESIAFLLNWLRIPARDLPSMSSLKLMFFIPWLVAVTYVVFRNFRFWPENLFGLFLWLLEPSWVLMPRIM